MLTCQLHVAESEVKVEVLNDDHGDEIRKFVAVLVLRGVPIEDCLGAQALNA